MCCERMLKCLQLHTLDVKFLEVPIQPIHFTSHKRSKIGHLLTAGICPPVVAGMQCACIQAHARSMLVNREGADFRMRSFSTIFCTQEALVESCFVHPKQHYAQALQVQF